MEAKYIIIDVETGYPSDEDIEAAMEDVKIPKNIKDPEKIAARKEEKKNEIRDKSALLDAAPVICICAKTETKAIAFNGMDAEQYPIDGCTTIGCAEEKAMLIGFREWMDGCTSEETVIVGHNLRGFDKPKLRNRYLVNRLRLPKALAFMGSETFDTMLLTSRVSVEHKDKFVSLDNLCRALNIEKPKQHFSGAEVPEAHKEGKHELILTYCMLDVMSTEQAYLIMSGKAMNLA